ncbi:DUF2716 domain-containing protein [Streptomyces sp. NPDC050803]|uniref:DUF2716 domain-containing protein n=1 Tax=unclassified Streptomyces TaxID=2593676 RepID=UPI00343DEAB3
MPELWGVVVDADGPLVRLHYGTHGVVDHKDLSGVDDLAALVRRQQEIFAARVEPVTWKVYSHDGPRLPEALLAAGFTPGPQRSLLLADVADVPAPDTEVRDDWHNDREKARLLADAAPAQRTPLSEQEGFTAVLTGRRHGRLVDLVWVEHIPGTDFASIGGISAPRPDLVRAAAAWAAKGNYSVPRLRYVVAEASGDLVPVHLAAGFHEVAEVTTYRWAPPGEPARDRPATNRIPEAEHNAIWKRFEERFEVTYATAYDGIAEPPGSVTWHTAALEHSRDPLLTEVEAVIARGLRACGRPGDRLYRLKWYINGTRCDPTRVGGPGQLPWPCYAYLTDENVIQVTEDLRMGTYGNWMEESLCVFGADLVAEVEEDLTRLLGTVLRRDGRPVGNVWTFGP